MLAKATPLLSESRRRPYGMALERCRKDRRCTKSTCNNVVKRWMPCVCPILSTVTHRGFVRRISCETTVSNQL